MLLIPEFRKVGDVTVYADDELWYRFYLVGSVPTIRRDDQGRPVFLLVKYSLDADAGGGKEVSGGYLNFDVQFLVEADAEAAAKGDLQTWVNEEYVRRKKDPANAGKPEYQAAQPPTVLLADPTWSRGTVKMLAPQAEALVSHRVADEPASLIAGNTAVFNMDLTPAGATFMQKTLVGADGKGATDLTPIQVVYDLGFWGRMPPVTIKITADSSRVLHSLQSAKESHGDNVCTPDEINQIQNNGVNTASLAQTGAIQVVIDKGDAKLSDDQMTTLTKYAFDMFDAMLKDKFLEPVPDAASDLPDDPGGGHDDAGSGDGADPSWIATLFEHSNYGGASQQVTADSPDFAGFNDKVSSLRVHPKCRITLYEHVNYGGRSATYRGDTTYVGDGWNDIFSSARIWRPSTTRYRSKRLDQTTTTNLSLTLEQSRVVEWPIAPQATMETFFKGMAPADLLAYVRELPLDDPFFQHLDLDVTVWADFANDPINFVTVEVRYGQDADGKPIASSAFTFSKSGVPQNWSPSLVGGSRAYEYRWQIGYRGGDAGASEFTPWTAGDSRKLDVSVVDPGKLDVQPFAGNVDFTIVRSVRLALAYRDAGGGVEPVDAQLNLDAATRSTRFTRSLFKPVRNPVSLTPTFFLTDGRALTGPEITTRGGPQPIDMPFTDVLDVSLVPAGDWSDVSQVVVELVYTDATGSETHGTFRLGKMEDGPSWHVLLADPARRDFKYQTLIVYKSGTVTKHDWVNATGDQALPVVVPASPRLVVNVWSSLVDFDATPVVGVVIAHGDATKTFSFNTRQTATWTLGLAEADKPDYTYAITYNLANGDTVKVPAALGVGSDVYVPKYKLPAAGKLAVSVNGMFADFKDTPLVTVDLHYRDPESGIDATGSIALSDAKKLDTWTVDVKDASRSQFSYVITYYRPDGTAVPGREQTSAVPRVVVPKFTA